MNDVRKLAVKYIPKSLKGDVVNLIRSFRLRIDRRKRIFPDFIIIGTQKGGTTSLFRYINEHPSVMPSLLKGTFFFIYHYNKGADYYKANFPTVDELSDNGKRVKITGESTADYIYYPGVERKIKLWMPEVKLLVILRNPVERSISEFFFLDVYKSSSKSFAEHVNIELDNISAALNSGKSYEEMFEERQKYPVLLRSLYSMQLTSWLETFRRDQIKVLQSEKLYQFPLENMHAVQDFLNLENLELADYPVYNITKKKRAIDEDIVLKLEKFFEPYNARLEEMLNQKFEW